MLRRMLERETSKRIKSVSELLAEPWLKGFNRNQIMRKQLKPVFQPPVFKTDFDFEKVNGR